MTRPSGEVCRFLRMWLSFWITRRAFARGVSAHFGTTSSAFGWSGRWTTYDLQLVLNVRTPLILVATGTAVGASVYACMRRGAARSQGTGRVGWSVGSLRGIRVRGRPRDRWANSAQHRETDWLPSTRCGHRRCACGALGGALSKRQGVARRHTGVQEGQAVYVPARPRVMGSGVCTVSFREINLSLIDELSRRSVEYPPRFWRNVFRAFKPESLVTA